MKKLFNIALRMAIASAVGVLSCGLNPRSDRVDGTSEVGNPSIQGMIRTTGNAPAQGAYVVLRKKMAMPLPAEIVYGDSTKTDTNGTFRYASVDTGEYWLEVNSHDTAGLVRSLSVGPNDTVIKVLDTIRPMGAVSGVIDTSYLTGSQTMKVYIPEVGRLITVSADMRFEAPALPPDTITIRIVADVSSTLFNAGDSTIVSVVSRVTVHVSIDSSGTATPLSGRQLDSLALVRLYKSTNGQNWLNNFNWLTSSPIDVWYHIGFDSSGRVNAIYLDNNGLSGTLPSSVGELTHLEYLYLDSNQITGELPSFIGKFSEFTASYNLMSGPLPPDIINSRTLYRFEISHNHFSGTLPVEFGTLTPFSRLDLSYNDFTGTIPDQLWRCMSLIDLMLNNNQFSGQVPSSVGSLRTLYTLDLSNNQLSGTLPSSIGNLKSLSTLNLSHNQFSGAFPAGINWVGTIIILRLNDNFFTDLPDDVVNINWLAEPASLQNNHLCNVSPAVKAWADANAGDWQSGQTCP
jgi:hypothetical protein